MTQDTIRDTQKLILLTHHIAHTQSGIILKRGSLQTHIEGSAIGKVFSTLTTLFANNELTRNDVLSQFSGSQHKAINQLLDVLISRRIIVNKETSNKQRHQPSSLASEEEIFLWHFNVDSPASVDQSTTQGSIVIVGNNRLSNIIANALIRSDICNLLFIDDISLRNIPINENTNDQTENTLSAINHLEHYETLSAIKNPALIVACSDFGGQHLLQPWNKKAIAASTPFLAVLQENMVGKLGPIVIPHQTACLECLSLRQNSQIDNFQQLRHYETLSTSTTANGYHHSMLHVLGESAAFEIMRFITGIANPLIGRIMEINLLQHTTNTTKLLKAPRCSACSSINKVALTNIEKSARSEHTWADLAEVEE